LNKRFQRLPPVKAVQALEALDRLGSLLAVADEMALTRPAVSHMLRRLETELGFALTEADGRSVRLTGRAKRYVDHTRKALVIMREAASDSEHRLAGELKIVCTPGLATFWLAPRLARFSSKHRDIRLTIATSRTLGEIQDETADVQLAYGDEALLRRRADLLAKVSYFPVCAPSMSIAEKGLSNPSDLCRFTLLHLVTNVHWQSWLKAAGADDVDSHRGITFSDLPIINVAAEAGLGVALGDSLTSKMALDKGTLVRPFSLSIPSRWSHFMRVVPDGPTHEAAKAFADWLRSEVAESV
jgi:LysR family glycine cleavage system transcriptional activator